MVAVMILTSSAMLGNPTTLQHVKQSSRSRVNAEIMTILPQNLAGLVLDLITEHMFFLRARSNQSPTATVGQSTNHKAHSPFKCNLTDTAINRPTKRPPECQKPPSKDIYFAVNSTIIIPVER